jgi:hypothetical protein
MAHDRGMQVALQLDDTTLSLLELLDEADAFLAVQAA